MVTKSSDIFHPILSISIATLVFLAFLLPQNLTAAPFTWQNEQLFESLEREFIASRKLSPVKTLRHFEMLESEGRGLLAQLKPANADLPETLLRRLEILQFQMGAIAAAHSPLLQRLQKFTTDLRQHVMSAATLWKAEPQRTQQILYRLIYGGRVAIEEAWLQSESSTLPSLLYLTDVAAETPSAIVNGVRVHSGDILLSRAGAPTSALISRGNDYRGKFSHAALLHIDAETKTPRIIEAHIEIGVVINTLEQYLEDKKQRVVVLRLRSDHPKLLDNPNLPHEAASAMLARAKKRLISYDFAMNYRNDNKLFCSEVVYHAYQYKGIELWQIKTLMSQPGLRAWLGDMGVKSFETIAPSDIEYDPQIIIIAEWRNLNELREGRIDSAIMDTLLEEAEKGLRVGYSPYQLPLASVVKFWSSFQTIFGIEPSIPKGMGVSTALRVRSLMKEIFPLLRQRLNASAQRFRKDRGYAPPYWSLLQLSRQTLMESLPELSPQLIRR